jgi:flagellar hook-length control protein FliK
MQPAPQLAPTNQTAPPRLLAGQPPAAAQSKVLPDAAGFGDQLAKALATAVATAKPAGGGAGQLAPPGPVAAAQVATEQGAQQIAPAQGAPVRAPDPVQAVPVPATGTLPSPPGVVPQQQPDSVAQRPRPTHADRREPKGAAAATTTADAATTDQPVAVAMQPLPIDATLQVLQAPGSATTADDAEASSAIAAQAVGHVPGSKAAIADATSSDMQPAGTHAAPHQADLPPTSPQSVSDQADTSITTPATMPVATPLALHPLPGDAATAPAATSASAAPASASNPQLASPAAQVAPALVAMGHAPDGAQRLTMRLAPPELGQVEIRIDRPPDAPARVDITVEKTETLTLLLRDQPQLLRALDQAGVPPEGRSVTFHVVAPEPPTRLDATSIPSPSGAASNGLAGEYSQGASRQGGQSAQQQQQTAPDGSDEAALADGAPPPWARWSSAGLDITA